MDKSDRRAAIRDYKERKSAPGIYAVRCGPAGEVWVGASPNIDAQRNSLWFGLRVGSCTNRALQAAWNQHGEAGLAFEVLERIEDEDLTPLGRADLLKRREQHWLVALSARKATG